MYCRFHLLLCTYVTIGSTSTIHHCLAIHWIQLNGDKIARHRHHQLIYTDSTDTRDTQLFDKPQKLKILVCVCVCEFVMQSTVCITLNGVKRCPREHGLKSKIHTKRHTKLFDVQTYVIKMVNVLYIAMVTAPIPTDTLYLAIFSMFYLVLSDLFCLLQEFVIFPL